MTKKRIWMAAPLLLAAAATGCSERAWRSPNQVDDSDLMAAGQARVEREAERTGDADSLYMQTGEESMFSLGEAGGILGGGSRALSQEEMRASRLYAGALAVVMELPVIVASAEGGFVATDWKVDPTDPGVRYRLNIRVSGEAPYGTVDVRVLKQALENGVWTDRSPDGQLAAQIAKAVRNRSSGARGQ